VIPTSPEHRLVLTRHAKSTYPSGVPDHERPLAGKGRRNAQATGAWFVAEGPRPDLVLCSDAVRSRQTWEIVAASLSPAPPVRLVAQLYQAGAAVITALARQLPDSARTVVFVGHEPVMSEAVLALAGVGSDPAALTRVQAKFPTSGVAVLRVPGGWSQVAVGRLVLETFAVPRA
jgi:phosphohistidine phosphatase